VSFLLDTDICSFHLRGRPSLISRFIQYSGRLSTSTISLGELYTWGYSAPNPTARIRLIQELIEDVTLLQFDANCAERFGILEAALRPNGITVPAVDLMIASVALTHDLTMVTHNIKHYEHISGLRLEDWISG
jgi:tRNA(fMet)-specific endonuclease VapC